jgi:hypothetical protein
MSGQPLSDPAAAALPAALPVAIRRQLAEIAASALGDLPEHEVPPALRRIRAFAPARRAKAAAGQLLAALDTDVVLRGHAALLWSGAHPELAAALPELAPGGEGEQPGVLEPTAGGEDERPGIPTADDEMWLVGAILLRPPRWQGLVGVLTGRLAAREARRHTRHAEAAARVRADAVAEELRRVRAELAHAQSQVAALTEGVAGLRREQRRLRADADRARAAAKAAEQEAVQMAARAEILSREAEAGLQRAAE